MQRVRIKIEGLRDPMTALKIAQMGADAIGLVFAESPRWVSPEQARAIVDVLPPWVLAAVLLDTYCPDAKGGTGRRFNWEMVADARAAGALAGIDPIILAGGLDPNCVGRAVDLIKPWAVDVASGVEKEPGVKDLRKVEAFIRATREGEELKSEFWL